MSIFERHAHDHVGKWFEQRRKLGVSDTIYWARYKPESDCLKMSEFHHAHGDGMSIMKHMLNEVGHGDTKIPVCRESGIPSRRQFKKIRENASTYPKKVKWLFWEANNKREESSLDTLLFNKLETKTIEQRAKTLGVPVTTLVLWALNRSAAKHLLQSSQEYSWFYPVNLRGAVAFGTDFANYSSGFYLPLNGDVSVQALHQRIRKKLKSGEHWVNWQQAKVSKYLPGIAIRWIYKIISNRHFYAGNFSAMGDWFNECEAVYSSGESNSKVDLSKERWFCCAPGTKNYPISSSMITWNGQLSLTLKLHPSIVKNEDIALDTLCEWGEKLLGGSCIKPDGTKKRNKLVSYVFNDTQPVNI